MIEVTLEPTKLIAKQPNELTICLTNAGNETISNVFCKLAFPVQVVLLKGSNPIETPCIEPGQKVRHTIKVEPKDAGTWALTSPNFSYRDGFGRTQRIKDLRLEITAIKKVAAPPPPGAKIQIQLQTTELPLNQWEKLEGVVSNISRIDLQKITLEVVGSVVCNRAISLGGLPAGASANFSMLVRASESGSSVPISIEVTHTDILERTKSQSIFESLRVTEEEKTPSPPSISIGDGSTFVGSTFGGGTVRDNKNVGTQHNYAPEQKQSLTESAAEIQQLLKQLEQSNPNATEVEKIAYINDETTPSFKRSFINALRATGEAAIDEFILEDKSLKVAKAAIKGWFQ